MDRRAASEATPTGPRAAEHYEGPVGPPCDAREGAGGRRHLVHFSQRGLRIAIVAVRLARLGCPSRTPMSSRRGGVAKGPLGTGGVQMVPLLTSRRDAPCTAIPFGARTAGHSCLKLWRSWLSSDLAVCRSPVATPPLCRGPPWQRQLPQEGPLRTPLRRTQRRPVCPSRRCWRCRYSRGNRC